MVIVSISIPEQLLKAIQEDAVKAGEKLSPHICKIIMRHLKVTFQTFKLLVPYRDPEPENKKEKLVKEDKNA